MKRGTTALPSIMTGMMTGSRNQLARPPRSRPRIGELAIATFLGSAVAVVSPAAGRGDPDPTPATAAIALSPGFVDLRAIDPTIVVDLLYAGSDNIVGRPLAGYRANICYLTVAAARALRRAQTRLRARGPYALRVRDCYRPERAVADLVRWARAGHDDLLAAGYIATVSPHSRGSAIDVDLVSIRGGAAVPLAMGTTIDGFGPRAHTASRDLTAEERAHRRLLLDVLRPEFVNYRKEWWHFVLRREPRPLR
jgi:zinc D-Ala-D-Ala dipeptidase